MNRNSVTGGTEVKDNNSAENVNFSINFFAWQYFDNDRNLLLCFCEQFEMRFGSVARPEEYCREDLVWRQLKCGFEQVSI
jgi:hypothetical protein